MSDQRPEWMPDEFDLDQTSYQIGVTDHDSGTVALCRMVYDTGLRAQIAVLEELSATPRINGIELKLALLRKELENG